MEGDDCSDNWDADQMDFNPLPPHGGRHWIKVTLLESFSFQSTPSAWRETFTLRIRQIGFYISIHSLRMEGDRW